MRIVLVLMAVVSPAAAQQRDTTVRDTVNLNPLTVTAARREERLLDLPLAVTLISRTQVAAIRSIGIDQALSLVPGVVASSRAGGSDVRITIRGFGARGAGDRSNSGTSRGIRVLMDGFPEVEPDGRTALDQIDLAAVQSLEVVRSNSSSLWGNAAGGVVAVSTVPERSDAFASTTLESGGFGLFRAAVNAAAPLGAGSVSASFAHTTFDGWRQNSAGKRNVANVTVLAPLADRTHLGVYAVGTVNDFEIPGPLTKAQLDSAPAQANATYLARHERRENTIGRLGISLDHAWGNAQGLTTRLYVNPKVLHRSERGTYRDFTRYHVGGSAVYRAGLRLGEGAQGVLQGGGDVALQDGAILFYNLSASAGRGDTLRNNQREGATNTGAFLEADLTLGNRWDVTLGARWDDITYTFQDFFAPQLDDTKHFQGVTPKAAVSFRIAPGRRLYASVGGGIEAPAGNETDPAGTFGQDTVTGLNPLLDAIRSTTYEVGTKHAQRTTAGPLRAVTYDAAVYWTEVRNEIVPYQDGRFYFTAGQARRRGAEVGAGLELAGGFTLRGAFTWLDHVYTEYVVDSVHYGVAGATADYSGNRVVGMPDLTWAASAEWEPPMLHPAVVRVQVQGQTDHFADDANQVTIDGYTIARVTLGTAEAIRLGHGWGVRGWVTVDNVFDRAYAASSFLNPVRSGGVPLAYEPGLPRSLAVGVSLGVD